MTDPVRFPEWCLLCGGALKDKGSFDKCLKCGARYRLNDAEDAIEVVAPRGPLHR